MNDKINRNPEVSTSVDSLDPQVPLKLKASAVITYTTIFDRSMSNATKKRLTTPDDSFIVNPVDMVRDLMETIRKKQIEPASVGRTS